MILVNLHCGTQPQERNQNRSRESKDTGLTEPHNLCVPTSLPPPLSCTAEIARARRAFLKVISRQMGIKS